MSLMQYKTTSEAYLAVLQDLVEAPDYFTAPRGIKTREVLNYFFMVDEPDSSPIRTHSVKRNIIMARYLRAEMELYLSGERKASVWEEKASKFWGKLANPDGTINSNYGWLLFFNKSLPDDKTPWEWARERLKEDPDTRQAIARLALPEHQKEGVKDQVCTMHLFFVLREGRLHLTTVMRSNDVIRGLAYDMPWFCYLLEKMANDVHARVGSYSHIAHSMHLYESDFKTALDMLGDKGENYD